jgi:hypothetical protein
MTRPAIAHRARTLAGVPNLLVPVKVAMVPVPSPSNNSSAVASRE